MMLKSNGSGGIKFDIIGLINLVIYVAVILGSVFLAVHSSIADLRTDTAVIRQKIEAVENTIRDVKVDLKFNSDKCQELDKRLIKLEP